MIDYDKPILNNKKEPIKLLMAANHTCIRVIKQLRALKKIGYQVDGLTNKISYGTEDFDSIAFFHDERQFKNYLYNNKGKWDIISWANEPDYQVKWIKEVVGDKTPLIVDLHDLDSIRRGFIPIPEREMFNYGDGFIFVSLPIMEAEVDLHKITKPYTVLYSYCNKGLIEYDDTKRNERSGLVYEGGANPTDDQLQNAAFAYRYLYDIIKAIVEMGNEVHMYCGNITAYNTYHGTGAKLYPPTNYNEMMQGLISRKYGIVGFNNENGKQQQVNLTLTNKMMEYMMAGLPSLAFWCRETEKYIEKHELGFTFKHINEIRDTSQLEDKYNSVMDNIKKKKEELVMENFIVLWENLMAELLRVPKKGVPNKIKKLHAFEFDNQDILK